MNPVRVLQVVSACRKQQPSCVSREFVCWLQVFVLREACSYARFLERKQNSSRSSCCLYLILILRLPQKKSWTKTNQSGSLTKKDFVRQLDLRTKRKYLCMAGTIFSMSLRLRVYPSLIYKTFLCRDGMQLETPSDLKDTWRVGMYIVVGQRLGLRGFISSWLV